MKRTLLFCFLLVFSFPSIAQDSTYLSQVIDINVGTQSASPSRLTAFNDKLVFFANDGTNGNELWVLTDSAIQLVFDMNPGSANAGLINNYTKMAVATGKIYFAADNGITGQELYSWDGDMNNVPVLVKDINTSMSSSTINEVISMDNKIYFPAYSPSQGYELWMHDPATLATTQITNIVPGAISSNPHNLVIYKGMLYFSATSFTYGTELYKYDPKTNNTTLVYDIYTGSQSSFPQSLVVLNDILYFSAMTNTNGRELYSFDSVIVNRLSDLNAGNASSILGAVTGQNRIGGLNGNVYFGGDDGTTGAQLYQHNKQNGTQVLTYNINPSGTSFPGSFINYGKNLYFSAYDDIHGIELWKYDGVNAPMMVADIDSIGSGNPLSFEIFKDVLYFSANTQDGGVELFKLVDSTIFAGVKNIRFDADIKVYPNPANSFATIELNLKQAETLNITLVDATGKNVFSTGMIQYTSGSNKINIPMSELSTGMYIYNIRSNSGSNYISGRLLKQ